MHLYLIKGVYYLSRIDTEKDADFIQSIEKGLAILKLFGNKRSSLTVSEAAELTNYSRPAVRRIFITLERLGYLKCHDRRYSLTAKVLELGYAYIASNNLWELTHPHMRELVEKTNESTSITVLDKESNEIVYVSRISTKRIMTISLEVGSRLPAHATSMGQVLLAYLPEEELNVFLNTHELKKYTKKTITEREKFIEKLKMIRKNGWGSSDEELEEGLFSIAAPIKNNDGSVSAAINISFPARVDLQQIKDYYVPLLLETADNISKVISKFDKSL